MIAELPRKPVFPEHMIARQLTKIAHEVEEQIIPVSTGAYSEYKILERIQAIPKPILVDYDDPIFYETVDTKLLSPGKSCPLCGEDYLHRKKDKRPAVCHFCGVWNCSQCICHRTRYHPRARDSKSERFELCYKCDDKFLGLQLSHAYVESKVLLEECTKIVRRDLEALTKECEKKQDVKSRVKELLGKNKFRIAQLKKEQLQAKKFLSGGDKQFKEQQSRFQIRKKYAELVSNKLSQAKKLQQKQRHELNDTSSSGDNQGRQRPKLQLKKAYSEMVLVNNPIQAQAYSQQDSLMTSKNAQPQAIQIVLNSPVPPPASIQSAVMQPNGQHEINSSPEQKLQSFVQIQAEETSMQVLANYFDSDASFLDISPRKQKLKSDEEVKTDLQRKLAEVFKKQRIQPTSQDHQNLEQDEQKQKQTLSLQLTEEEVARQKSILVKNAAQEAIRLRKENIHEEEHQFQLQTRAQPQKCTCQIY